jgi:hypothetical protein
MVEFIDDNRDECGVEPIGDIPPAEFEAMYYEGQEGLAREAGLKQTSLR